MARRKRDRTRLYNILDSRSERPELDGSWFVLWPARDPIAWKTLKYYAVITPNVEQRQAILKWLAEHPDPAPVIEQLEMAL